MLELRTVSAFKTYQTDVRYRTNT